MRRSTPIVACQLAEAASLNAPLAAAFAGLKEADFQRRTHFVDGRFENLYLAPDRLPGLAPVLECAMQRAREILSDSRWTWWEAPLAASAELRSGFWLNAMEPRQRTSRHSHDEHDELLSGVYYIAVPANAGDILFHDGPFETRVTPKPGVMLLFPPALQHSVEPNRSAERRLSLAFNIGPRP